jgi:DNA polymerase-3 subunit alpha
VQFFAASMTCERSNRDQVIAFVKDARAHGIEVLPPDVNTCYADFRPKGGKIHYGLSAIKNIGDKAVEAIAAAREAGGPFHSIFDFCERADSRAVSRAAIETLIKCGACDGLGGTRAQMLAALDRALQVASAVQQDRSRGQTSLFDLIAEPATPAEQQLPEVQDALKTERQSWEKDLLGFYVSGHPLEEQEELLRMYATATTAKLSDMEDGTEVVVGGIIDAVRHAVTRKGRFEGQRWARYEFSDLEGSASGVMFAQEYAQCGQFLKKDAIVFIRGRVDFQGNAPSLRAQQVVPIERAHAILAGGLLVELDAEAADPETLKQLCDLCASHHGPLPVYVRVRIPDEGAYLIRAGHSFTIEASNQLYEAARQLLGAASVRFVPRQNGVNGTGQGGNARPARRWRE